MSNNACNLILQLISCSPLPPKKILQTSVTNLLKIHEIQTVKNVALHITAYHQISPECQNKKQWSQTWETDNNVHFYQINQTVVKLHCCCYCKLPGKEFRPINTAVKICATIFGQKKHTPASSSCPPAESPASVAVPPLSLSCAALALSASQLAPAPSASLHPVAPFLDVPGEIHFTAQERLVALVGIRRHSAKVGCILPLKTVVY